MASILRQLSSIMFEKNIVWSFMGHHALALYLSFVRLSSMPFGRILMIRGKKFECRYRRRVRLCFHPKCFQRHFWLIRMTGEGSALTRPECAVMHWYLRWRHISWIRGIKGSKDPWIRRMMSANGNCTRQTKKVVWRSARNTRSRCYRQVRAKFIARIAHFLC